jgi:hypothetical protein
MCLEGSSRRPDLTLQVRGGVRDQPPLSTPLHPHFPHQLFAAVFTPIARGHFIGPGAGAGSTRPGTGSVK